MPAVYLWTNPDGPVERQYLNLAISTILFGHQDDTRVTGITGAQAGAYKALLIAGVDVSVV